MIRAYHIIFGAYGFWLSNDPRGSWSDFVRSWELYHFGRATTVTTRHSVASRPHDVERRRAAKMSLRYPAVQFTGHQARSIARGFHRAINESHYVVHACSILPVHVHLVLGRSPRRVEQVIAHLKARATQQLAADCLHPLAEYRKPDGSHPSPWAEHGWRVYLNDDGHVNQSIAYVQANPTREGKPQQRWSFVVSYKPQMHV